MNPKDDTAARQIIGMALRRVREGGGSYCADTPGAWRQQAPDLNVWLAPVRFAIVGGLATRLYMPERMTQDLADISRMLGLAETADRERVRAAVARYRPQDAADLDSLILLGRKETGTGE